jgi:Ras-related protein Rab-5C
MMKQKSSRLITSKVVLLGESSVGKTSVVMRGSRDEFYQFQEPTIGASFLTAERMVGENKVRLELWDTAGQERYRSLAPMYYRGASAAIIVYDITQPDTLKRAREWMEELYARMPASKCKMVLVGNKCDMGTTSESMLEVTEQMVADFSRPNAEPIRHFMVSAKTGEGVEGLFAHVCDLAAMVEGTVSGESDARAEGFVLDDRRTRGYVDMVRGLCG